MLSLYPALKSYFLSNSDSSARFKRLKKGFADPMTEVYLYFLDSVLPTFTHFNLLLQRGEPAVHILHNQMLQFIKKLLGKFVKASELTVPLSEIVQVDYKDPSKYANDERLVIGFATKNSLRKLINDGDVTDQQCDTFHDGVRAFLIGALDYATTHLPLGDEVLKNAQFVDVMNRTEANVNQVYYFVERFQSTLNMHPSEINELEDEFVDYQTMCDRTLLPAHILQEAKVYEDDEQYIKDSVIWNYLSILKDRISGDLRFRKLSKIAKLVLTLPHTNADEERVFSLIRKNKILSRSSLDIYNTLSSILTVKMSNLEPCYKYEPSSEVLLAAKKATWSYNQTHAN